MSRRKSALFALIAILAGSLTLAAPQDSATENSDDKTVEPSSARVDTLKPLLQRLAEFLPQVDIEIDTGAYVPCEQCATCCEEKPDKNTVTSPQQVEVRLLIAEVVPGKLEGIWMEASRAEMVRNFPYGKINDAGELRGFLRALKQEGKARIIAEPTMISIDGRPASMVVGGEFPIFVPGQNDTITVEFREYGTRVEWVATVLGPDRVRLEMRNELSSLDHGNGVVLHGLHVPGIVQRRFDTAIEMKSGETYVLGGPCSSSANSNSSDQNRASLSTSVVQATLTPSCLSGPAVSPICVPVLQAISSCSALPQQSHESKDLVIMVTANLIAPIKPLAPPASHENEKVKAADLEMVAASSDSEFQRSSEMDADQPHRPAVLLLGARSVAAHSPQPCPAPARRDGTVTCTVHGGSECPTVHDLKVKVAQAADGRIIFGEGVNSDAAILGNVVITESRTQCDNCPDACCSDAEDDEDVCPGQCKSPIRIQTLDSEGSDDCDDAVEGFISQVLQSHMQYLEGMMRARLHHEKELMEARAAAESALAKQKVEHAEEVMKLRLDHMAEILTMQEAVWETERKAMADRHRDTIEHEREVAELRAKHVEELQSQRIAALESEVNLLRGQAGSSEPERVAHTPEDLNRHSNVTRRPVLVELPIHVEDLTSGRVRYSPVPPKPGEQVTDTKDRIGVERVELTTPPISATRPTPTEIERLRREVARLHALIEDLVCIAPEAPPSPKPQSSIDDDDD